MTWRDLLPPIAEIYSRSSAGCCWHGLLEDGNFERDDIYYSAETARLNNHRGCIEFGELAKKASRTQIIKAARNR